MTTLREIEHHYGRDLLFRINTLIGSGMLFPAVLDKVRKNQHGLKLTLRDISVARSWWSQCLPTDAIRRLVRHLPLAMSDAYVRNAKASCEATAAQAKFKEYLTAFPGHQRWNVTRGELEDIRSLVGQAPDRTYYYAWVGFIDFAIHYASIPSAASDAVQSCDHQFRIWLLNEVRSGHNPRTEGGASSLPETPYLLIRQFVRWLEHHNPLDERNHRP